MNPLNATAREKKIVIRCFKCLEFGYVTAECPKDILEKLCYRCGEPGHLAAGCGKLRKCLAREAIGKPQGHRTGDVTYFPSVNMLQININRSRQAQDPVIQTARERDVGILLIVEQNRDLYHAMWFKNKRGDAAIYVCKDEYYRATEVISSNGHNIGVTLG